MVVNITTLVRGRSLRGLLLAAFLLTGIFPFHVTSLQSPSTYITRLFVFTFGFNGGEHDLFDLARLARIRLHGADMGSDDRSDLFVPKIHQELRTT